LTAHIQEKQRARLEYESAKKEGKTSALLEQERPNVFQMNVANILPGDDVRVELHYTELIAPNDGRYEVVFSTVVGPRYHRPARAGGSSSSPASPYLHAGEASSALLEMNVALSAPLPISDIASPSHTIEVQGDGSRQVQVYTAGASSANRDFILDYR